MSFNILGTDHVTILYQLERNQSLIQAQVISLLPSSAQAQAQAQLGLSWLYSQLIQPPPPPPTPTRPGKFFLSSS